MLFLEPETLRHRHGSETLLPVAAKTKRRSQRREADGDEPVDVLSVFELGEQAAEAKTVPEDRLDSVQARLFVSSLFILRPRVVRCFAYTKNIRGIDFVPCSSRVGRCQFCLRICLPGVRSDHGHRIRVSKLRQCSKPVLSTKCLHRILIVLLKIANVVWYK